MDTEEIQRGSSHTSSGWEDDMLWDTHGSYAAVLNSNRIETEGD